MYLKKYILALAWSTGINIMALLAGCILDIILTALMLRFSSQALTITCLAVSGVFAGLFSYQASLQTTSDIDLGKLAAGIVVITLLLCAAIFFFISPLSGKEYNVAFKAFAVSEVLIVFFLWKNKFHFHP